MLRPGWVKVLWNFPFRRYSSGMRVQSPRALHITYLMASIDGLVGQQMSTILSYNSPVVQNGSMLSRPYTEGNVVVVHTSPTGTFGSSAKFRLGLTSAEYSAWIAEISVIAKVVRVRGVGLQVVASVALRTGSATQALTYVGVTVSSFSSVCLPVTGSAIATVFGKHMSSEESSPKASSGGTASQMTEWRASTALRLKTAAGVATMSSVVVSVDTRSALLTRVLSYLLPIVSNYTVAEFPLASGSQFVTLSGSLLGPSAGTASSRIGISASVSSTWKSDSSVIAKVRSGAGGLLALSLSATGLSGILNSSIAQSRLSYSRPAVQSIAGAVVFPTTGGSSVFAICRSLSSASYCPSVRIMFSAASSSVWVFIRQKSQIAARHSSVCRERFSSQRERAALF